MLHIYFSVAKYVKKDQHSISLTGGLCMYSYNKTGIISLSAGLNYLYRLNKYVSFTAGIQMPVIRGARYNEYYQNPFITFGVQFF